MQFLPIVAVFSTLLFSMSLASPIGKQQLNSTDMESIVNTIVDELVKTEALLAQNETTGPIVMGLGRKRQIRCHFVKGRCICRYIGKQIQLKMPETGNVFPAEISFNLTATLDDQQQPNKIKTLAVEGMNIKVLDKQKSLGPNSVGLLDLPFKLIGGILGRASLFSDVANGVVSFFDNLFS